MKIDLAVGVNRQRPVETEKIAFDLKLNKVNIAFGTNLILDQVSLQVKSGEVLGLLGDNGAGKSTLIKIIAGFHRPNNGTMSINGKTVEWPSYNPQSARNAGIQTVYQHLGLVEQLTLARNFFLGCEPTKKYLGFVKLLDNGFMRKVVKEELEKLGIKRKLDPDDVVANLSGGERQAIAIARAKYFGAKLLILDEPTSALSLRQTNEVLEYIRSARAQGIAVILITHSLHHCKEVVDTLSIIHQGRNVGHYRIDEISEKTCSNLIIHGTKDGSTIH